MAKHSMYDLAQLQSLPLRAKIQATKNRIRAWYDHWDGDVYIAFSGGKDSTVLKHIIDSMYPDVPAVFVQTGQEYPEVRKFAMAQKNVVVLYPEKSFLEVTKEYGFPVISKEQAQFFHELAHTQSEKLRNLRLNGRNEKRQGGIAKKWLFLTEAPFKISHKCCYFLKKRPSEKYEKETGRKPFLGTMVWESALRQQKWLKEGCNAFETLRPMSTPLSFWTEQDILQYIKQNNVEIASVYGRIETLEDGTLHLTGCQRTGCIACAFGVQREKSPNRFERLKVTHPNQWKYVIHKVGYGEVLKYMGIPFGERNDTRR